MHLSHAVRGILGGSSQDAFTLCLYEDAHTGTAHLALLHGCHLTIYGVISNSKIPVLTSAPALRLTWDQAEEISLHDSPTRNSAAGNESLSGASATSGKAVDDILHRTTAGPLSRLTSALRADLDLLTRCMSAPAQLVEAAESLSTPASQCEPRPAQGNSKGVPAHDLSFDVHLRVKTGLPSVHGKHHKKTPPVPKPEDSGDLRQAINTINSVPVGLASGLNRRMSSGQDRRVSFAELDEVVGDGHSTKYPPSPHPRKLSGNSGAFAAPQRSALKPASAMTRLSNGSQVCTRPDHFVMGPSQPINILHCESVMSFWWSRHVGLGGQDSVTSRV